MKRYRLLKAISSLALLCMAYQSSYAAPNSLIAPDIDGVVGQYTSMALDTQGNPVISYYDASEAKLKVMHCFDNNCSTFNSILTPDANALVGQYTSIVLDPSGNPYVSYYDAGNSALKVLHCGTSSCSAGNTISTVDNNGNVGLYTSITLDNANLPVVSYYDSTNGRLKVLHCGNAACNAGNAVVTPDNTSSNGVQSAVRVSNSGNPVVAYFDFTNSSLKLLRCGNAQCTAGNAITTLDSTGDVGRYPSMRFDGAGKPVISYLDLTNGKLKIIHCGNTSCSVNNSIVSVGVYGTVGYYSSLMLDASGNPVVSYYDLTNGDLNVLHCGNANCSAGNVTFNPDSTGVVGSFTSLKLDSNGRPVVSYYDSTNGNLKVLHCGSTNCNPNSITVADGSAEVGRYSAIKLDINGKPVVSYWDSTNGNLKLLHCGNANCTASNSIAAVDTVGNTGWDTSLAMDANDFPVISYYDFTNGVMKVAHCSNANCSVSSSLIAPDILSRRYPSVALDANGFPIVVVRGQADQGIRVVHCGDANCSANNTMTSPDFPAYPFNSDIRGVSMALDVNGFPVASYYRADKNQLKILHCVDASCSGANSIVAVDPGAQASDHRSTSMMLDSNGNPVVAYQDLANQALKVMRCGNANCSAGNTIASPVTGPSIGFSPSLKLDASGKPVVSFSSTNGLSILRCGNTACTSGNTVVAADTSVTGAWDDALILDASGFPVVSYYDPTGKKLKVLHCQSATCQ